MHRLPAAASAPRRTRRLLAAAALAGVLAGTGAGCATGPAMEPPVGLDGLTVPTPVPDPDDFVAEVDNPWFPLPDGARGTVAGVPVTSVGTGESHQQPAADGGTDHYAQDTAGNVWWLGREGEWEAGVAGAEAGLLLAADPRTGDGYRTAYLPGVVEERATVLAVEDDRLEIRFEDPLDPAAARVVTYERGVGPVAAEAATADGVTDR